MLRVDVVELVLTKNSFGCLSTCLALLGKGSEGQEVKLISERENLRCSCQEENHKETDSTHSDLAAATVDYKKSGPLIYQCY